MLKLCMFVAGDLPQLDAEADHADSPAGLHNLISLQSKKNQASIRATRGCIRTTHKLRCPDSVRSNGSIRPPKSLTIELPITGALKEIKADDA